MTILDGTVLGRTRIIDHGPESDRWNIVILGDGYQSSEMTKYHNDVQDFVNRLQTTAPFDTLWAAINIDRVDVASTDSGADDPATCADGSVGSGATRRTYFDAKFCGGGQDRRVLTVTEATAIAVATVESPLVIHHVHMMFVIVNSANYGGSGGMVAVFSTASDPVIPPAEIGIHEMGHTGFNLADEYCIDKGANTFIGAEPTNPNVTIDTNRITNKWRDLIQPTTNMPTKKNPDCAKCDTDPSPAPAGTVGTFEGALYTHCGCFRPQFSCRMRTLGEPFCAVCQRAIRDLLTNFLP
jgi:hypothetical protein